MDEKNINISKSEEELLEIMENRSHITADQLHNLKEDEECLQACSDLAEIVIEMQKKQNMLAIDVRNEMADFHNKHSKNNRRKNTRMLLWASITGVAAAVVIILVLRAMMISSQPEIIQVFQANHVAQEVQSPNQKIPDRKTKCVIKTHINIKQNVIFGAKLKPV